MNFPSPPNPAEYILLQIDIDAKVNFLEKRIQHALELCRDIHRRLIVQTLKLSKLKHVSKDRLKLS